MIARPRIAFAVDAPSSAEATPLVERLAPHVDVLKIGLELFVAEGPAVVAWARAFGREVFLDLKLHDIPETVDRAVARVADLGVRYLTVHAGGGAAMIERAARRAEGTELTVLGVTVLTSLSAADLASVGVVATPVEQVSRLARLAWSAGARGFVTSVEEVAALRDTLGPEPLLVTPGIRLGGHSADDQRRIATPAEAARRGADLLVIGRPLRDAADPVRTAQDIAAELAQAAR